MVLWPQLVEHVQSLDNRGAIENFDTCFGTLPKWLSEMVEARSLSVLNVLAGLLQQLVTCLVGMQGCRT